MLLSKKEREFRKSYSDYYSLVVNALYNRVKNLEDAEDICHEIFVSYYRKFDEIHDARSWLMGAMRYSISNYYRKMEGSDSSYIDIDRLEDDVHLSFENGARDMRIIINDAIENRDNYRDERERILFDLVAINHYTYDQAAKHLGLTRRQAAYKYRQVSRRILDLLKQRGICRIEDLI
ncbi:MAG: sigma-70 family RNA polymerase sigma factor [Spirochaetes bacterium]|nr:sigma-70 family RNA polymerase sigma factor [Spirochaetota bacterium]